MDASRSVRDFFPRIEPYEQGQLDLDGPHRMYWEQSGNPNGVPVLLLHGGPGAGASPTHRRFFDPAFYRIVIFDQRGAGRSAPYAEIRANTTAHLIADIERLRQRLGVERWLVFGGSWGALLALAYGIAHPGRCSGFVLRGVFLGRRAEIDWFMGGMRAVFPEAWRAFAGHVLPIGELAPAPEALLAAYRRRLDDPDPAVHL
ncbi:MAG: alpha/beta fold hydrolase, partial [Alphaproteobacteria bacterium]|nr:alpha/beta fold hydrolase [Alphaproteobacteria bacterium]